MNTVFTESEVEASALFWLAELGYETLYGPDILPGEARAEREDCTSPILPHRLKTALQDLNPTLPDEAIDEAYRKLTRLELPSLIRSNQSFHRMLVNGIEVEYRNQEGAIRGDAVKVIDLEYVDENDFCAINQFTMIGKDERRPDVVLFV